MANDRVSKHGRGYALSANSANKVVSKQDSSGANSPHGTAVVVHLHRVLYNGLKV